MKCPRCEALHNILQYIPLAEVDEYKGVTNPIYKCPKCKWLFSPAPHITELFDRNI